MALEEDCGFVRVLKENGELGSPYPLGFGNTTIGSCETSDIRLKKKDKRLELLHCVINVHDQGLATLVNKSQKNPVKINGVPVEHFQVLNNNDIFEVVGKKFKYVNEQITSENVSKLQKTLTDALSPKKSRKSVFPLITLDSPKTPNIKMKTPVKKQLSKTISKLIVSKPLSSRSSSSARKQRLSLGNSSKRSNLTPKISSRNILLGGPSKTPSKSILDSSVEVSVLKTPLKPTLNNASGEDTTPVRRSNLSKSIIKSSTKKNLIKRHSSTPKIITPQRKLLNTPLRTPLNTISPIKKGVASSTKKDTPDSKYLTPNNTMSSSRSMRKDNSVKSSQRSLLYESVQSKTNDTPNVSNVSKKSKKGNSSKLLTDNAPYLNQSGQSDVGLIVKSGNSSTLATFNDSLDLNITDSIPNYSRISLEKAEEVERSLKQTSTPLKTPKPGKTPKSCLRRKALENLTSDSRNNDTLSDLYTARELEMIKSKLDKNETFNSFDTSADLTIEKSKRNSTKDSSVQFVESFTTPENNKSVVFINTPEKSEKSTRKSKKFNANSIITIEDTPSATPKSAIKSVRKSLDDRETPQAHENTSMSAVKSRLTNLYSNSEEMGKLSGKKGVKRGRESTGSILHSTKKLKLSSFTSSGEGDTSYDIMDALESNNSMSEGLPDYFSNLTDKPIIDEPRRNRSLTAANMRNSEKRRSLHPMKFESFNTYQSKLGRSKSYRSQEMLDDTQDESVSGSSKRSDRKSHGDAETEVETETQDSMSVKSRLSNRKSVAEISNVDETEESFNTSSAKKDIGEGSNTSRRSRFSTRRTFDSTEVPNKSSVNINETTPNKSSHMYDAEESFSNSPLDTTSNRSTRKGNVNEVSTSKRSRLSTRKTLDADHSEEFPLDNTSKGSARKSSAQDINTSRRSRFSTRIMESDNNETNTPHKSTLDFEESQESLHYSENGSSIENPEDDNNTSRSSRISSRQTFNADIETKTPNKSRFNDTEQSVSYSNLEVTSNTSKKSGSSTRKSLSIADDVTPNKSSHLNVTEDFIPDSAFKGSSRKSSVHGNTSRKSRLSTRIDIEANTHNKSALDLDGTQESLHLDDTVESISSSPLELTSDTSKKSRFSSRRTMDIADVQTPNKSLNLNDIQVSTSKGSARKSSIQDKNSPRRSRLSTKMLENPVPETNTPNKSTLDIDGTQESLHLSVNGSSVESTEDDNNTSRRSRVSTRQTLNIADSETKTANKSLLNVTEQSLSYSPLETTSNRSEHNTSKKSRFSTRKTMDLTDSETVNISLQLNDTVESISSSPLELTLDTSKKSRSSSRRTMDSASNKSLNLNDIQESTSKGSTRKSIVVDNNTSKKSRLSTRKSLEIPDVEANISNKSPAFNDTQESLSFSLHVSSNDTSKLESSPAKTPNKSTKKSKKPTKVQKEPENDLTDVQGVKKLFQTPKVVLSPMNDLSNVSGVKKLLRTPRVQNEPQNDLTNVEGLKKLFQSPKVQHSPNNDLRDVQGVKKLLQTPKVQKSPSNDLTNVQGVKRLLRTPKPQKEPENDLTNVQGVKKLMQTPKVVPSPKNDLSNVSGVKRLLRTPKVQKEPHNDLTNVQGVKKLLKTPKEQKSPLNDLRNVVGVARLLRSPKVQKSPRNDLSDVEGVDRLFDPERLQNDLNVLNLSGVQVLTDDLFDQISPKKKVRTYPGRTPKKQEQNEVSESLPGSPANKEFFESWIKDQKVLKEIENLPNTAEKVESPQPKDVPIKENTENISPKKKTRGRKIMSDHDIVEPINVVLSTEKPTQKKTAPSKTRRKNVMSDDIVMESPKRNASRKNKNDDLRVVVSPLNLEEVSKTRGKRKAEEEGIEEPKAKTSRRGKKVSAGEESNTDGKEEVIEEPKTKTPRRGKKVAAGEENNTDDKEEVMEEPKPKTSRRGKKVVALAADDESNTDDKEEVIKEPKTKTSRRGKKVAAEEENNPDDKEEVMEEPKPKTSRRGKRVVALAANDESNIDDKEEVIEEPKTKTSRRGKKVAVNEEEEIKDVKPNSRSRGKKHDPDEVSETVQEEPIPKSTRGRRNIVEDVIETVKSIEVSEEAKPKNTRGRKRVVKEDQENASSTNEPTKVSPKRTRRGRKQEILEEANEEPVEEPTKTSPKKTRKGSKVEEVKEIVKTSVVTPSKSTRGRKKVQFVNVPDTSATVVAAEEPRRSKRTRNK